MTDDERKVKIAKCREAFENPCLLREMFDKGHTFARFWPPPWKEYANADEFLKDFPPNRRATG